MSQIWPGAAKRPGHAPRKDEACKRATSTASRFASPPGDTATVSALFERLGSRSRERRFCGAKPRLSDAELGPRPRRRHASRARRLRRQRSRAGRHRASRPRRALRGGGVRGCRRVPGTRDRDDPHARARSRRPRSRDHGAAGDGVRRQPTRALAPPRGSRSRCTCAGAAASASSWRDSRLVSSSAERTRQGRRWAGPRQIARTPPSSPRSPSRLRLRSAGQRRSPGTRARAPSAASLRPGADRARRRRRRRCAPSSSGSARNPTRGGAAPLLRQGVRHSPARTRKSSCASSP